MEVADVSRLHRWRLINPMNGELNRPGKYPPDASAMSGWATPLTIPATARNQAAKNANFCAERSVFIEATQIAIHARLKTTKTHNGMGSNPNKAGKRIWKSVAHSSAKCAH